MRTRSYGIYVAVVLAGLSFFQSLDQSVLPAVAASIQREFRIHDAQIGALLSAFVVATALASIPFGYWADRGTRKTILGLGAAVWSLATLVTGMTQNFPQMLAARAVLGIGEASGTPVAASLIGDYFSKRARGRALGAVIAVSGLGAGAGLVLGGAVGLHLGWRWAFYIAAVPGFVLALLAFRMREPLRGAGESAGPKLAAVKDAGISALARLFRIRTYAAVLAAGATIYFGLAVYMLVPLYLHRRFGLNVAQAGALVGIPLLFGVVVGNSVSGWWIDWRGRRSPRASVETGFVGLAVTGVAAIVMFSARSVAVFEAGTILFVLFGSAGILASNVAFQNVIQPSLRASAVSINITIGRVFGALGPLVVGAISDFALHDLGLSLLLVTPAIYFVGAACFALALRSMNRDVEAMEESWALRAGA
jgi:MFS family permease